MFRIEVGDKKEAILYGITLGCLLLLVFGVSRIYWSGRDTGLTSFQSSQIQRDTGVTSTDEKSVTGGFSPPSPVPDQSESNQLSSWVFFGTVIIALLLLFCLAFRYYARREMREAEQKWENTCENFVTRMETKRIKSPEKHAGVDSLWSRILNGDK